MINKTPKIFTVLIFSSVMSLSVVATAQNLSSGTQFSPIADQRPINFGVIADTGINGQLQSMIMNDSTLSTNAQNVTIVNINGVPTLTGSVATKDERSRLSALAGSLINAQMFQNKVEVRSR